MNVDNLQANIYIYIFFCSEYEVVNSKDRQVRLFQWRAQKLRKESTKSKKIFFWELWTYADCLRMVWTGFLRGKLRISCCPKPRTAKTAESRGCHIRSCGKMRINSVLKYSGSEWVKSPWTRGWCLVTESSFCDGLMVTVMVWSRVTPTGEKTTRIHCEEGGGGNQQVYLHLLKNKFIP